MCATSPGQRDSFQVFHKGKLFQIQPKKATYRIALAKIQFHKKSDI